MSEIGSASIDGWDVKSSTHTPEELKKAFEAESKPEPKEDDPKKVEAKKLSESASNLGKKGGEAAAKARAAKAKEAKEELKVEVKSAAEHVPDDDEEDEDEDEEIKPKANRADDPRFSKAARIRELSQERAVAKARADALEARLAAIEAQGRPTPKEEAREAPEQRGEASEKPRVEQFPNYEDFTEALADWKIENKVRAITEQDKNARQEEEAERIMNHAAEGLKAQFAKAAESEPDVMDKIDPELMASLRMTKPGSQPDINSIIGDAVLKSSVAVEILKHFTDHPEACATIAKMGNWVDIHRAVAKLEARFEFEREAAEKEEIEPPEPKHSKAPPPIRPLKASPHKAAEDEDPDDLDTFIRVNNAREKRATRGR